MLEELFKDIQDLEEGKISALKIKCFEVKLISRENLCREIHIDEWTSDKYLQFSLKKSAKIWKKQNIIKELSLKYKKYDLLILLDPYAKNRYVQEYCFDEQKENNPNAKLICCMTNHVSFLGLIKRGRIFIATDFQQKMELLYDITKKIYGIDLEKTKNP